MRPCANGEVAVDGPTATGSAGTAPYVYTWTKLSGSSALTIASGNTAQLGLTSNAYGATLFGTFRCSVVDALGSVGSVDVNVSILHRDRYYRYGEDAP